MGIGEQGRERDAYLRVWGEVPFGEQEKEDRLEQQDDDEKNSVPALERLLVDLELSVRRLEPLLLSVKRSIEELQVDQHSQQKELTRIARLLSPNKSPLSRAAPSSQPSLRSRSTMEVRRSASLRSSAARSGTVRSASVVRGAAGPTNLIALLGLLVAVGVTSITAALGFGNSGVADLTWLNALLGIGAGLFSVGAALRLRIRRKRAKFRK